MHLLEDGQMIRDTYEVERFLGEGAFAEVYRVKHRFLGRQAMKVFKRVGMNLDEIQDTGEVREDMKRVDRHIEAIRRDLEKVGIVIRDHTGDVYDEGQPMKVIASKPTQGLDKKRVSETLLPSIFWNNRLIQNGEIEIATPLTPIEPQNFPQ